MKGKQETKQFPQTLMIKHVLNFKNHPSAYVPTTKVSKRYLVGPADVLRMLRKLF